MLWIYLSGPMTDRPHFNYPLFHRLAARLRARGLSVLNPAELKPAAADPTWKDYMAPALAMVKRSSIVLALPDWEESRGARLEIWLARRLGLVVLILADHPELYPERSA